MESQTPIQIHIPPSLAHLAIPLSTFLAQNSNTQYTNLAVSSFIFAPSSSNSTSLSPTSSAPPRLLIVQRATTERSFPNLWEVPGGSCEVSDPTVLHSLARETFEETGLRLTRFCRQIGHGEEFVTGYGAREKKWRKLSFEIEVAEINGVDAVEEGVGGVEDVNEVSVTLDPTEHQAYAWVMEEEIKEDKYAIITAKAKELMLEAFATRKIDAERSEVMLAAATSAVPAKIGLSG